MVVIRAFTSQFDDRTVTRSLDDDAPPGLRHEFIDAALHVLEEAVHYNFDEVRLYHIVSQMLGEPPSAQPGGGYRRAMSTALSRAALATRL